MTIFFAATFEFLDKAMLICFVSRLQTAQFGHCCHFGTHLKRKCCLQDVIKQLESGKQRLQPLFPDADFRYLVLHF